MLRQWEGVTLTRWQGVTLRRWPAVTEKAGLLYSAQAQAQAHEATTKMRMMNFVLLVNMLHNVPAARVSCQPLARVRGRRLAVPSCRGSSETVARLPRTGTGLAGLRLLLLLQIFQGLSSGRNPLSRAGQGTQGDGQSHRYCTQADEHHAGSDPCQRSGV